MDKFKVGDEVIRVGTSQDHTLKRYPLGAVCTVLEDILYGERFDGGDRSFYFRVVDWELNKTFSLENE